MKGHNQFRNDVMLLSSSTNELCRTWCLVDEVVKLVRLMACSAQNHAGCTINIVVYVVDNESINFRRVLFIESYITVWTNLDVILAYLDTSVRVHNMWTCNQ